MRKFFTSATCFITAALLTMLLCSCGGHPAAAGTASVEGASASPAETASHGGEASASPELSEPGEGTSAPAAAPTPSTAATATPQPTLAQGWMPGIPAYVPEFTAGQMDEGKSGVGKNSTGLLFTLCFRGVNRADLDAYVKELGADGFVTACEEIDGEHVVTASYKSGRKITTLMIVFSPKTGDTIFSLGVPQS